MSILLVMEDISFSFSILKETCLDGESIGFLALHRIGVIGLAVVTWSISSGPKSAER